MFNSDSTMVSTEGKDSMLVTKELVEKMTGEYNLRNKHEVKLYQKNYSFCNLLEKKIGINAIAPLFSKSVRGMFCCTEAKKTTAARLSNYVLHRYKHIKAICLW